MAIEVREQSKGEKIYLWYTRYRDDSYAYRVERDRMLNMYFGNQTPPELQEELEDSDTDNVILNTIRPRIRQRVNEMTANHPTGHIYGVPVEYMDTSISLQYLLDYVCYISKFNWVTEQVVLDCERIGVGYYIVAPDPTADYGRGEIKIKYASHKNVFFDANCTEWDFSDAPRMIHTRLMELDDFRATFPHEELSEDDAFKYGMASDEISWIGYSEETDGSNARQLGVHDQTTVPTMIRVYDLYERVVKKQRCLRYLTGTVIPLTNDYVLSKDEQNMINEGVIEDVDIEIPRILFSQAYGNMLNMKMIVEDYELPISDYPIVPVVCEYTGNSMPVGEVDFIERLQMFKNKAADEMLKNAALHSRPLTYGDASTITDGTLRSQIEQARRNGDIIWINRTGTGDWPLHTEQPQSINQAFAYLVNFFSQAIDSGMSTYEFGAGNPTQAPNTATMGLSLSEAAAKQLKSTLSHLECAIERVFDLVLELIPVTYKHRKIFPIISHNDEVSDQDWVINDDNYKEIDGKIHFVGKLNDVTQLRAKYRIKAGSTLPPNTMSKLALLKDMAAASPVFLKYMIQYLPEFTAKEKQQMVAEMDMIPQLKQAVSQLQEALKEQQSKLESSESTVSTLTRENEKLRERVKLARQSNSDSSEKGNK